MLIGYNDIEENLYHIKMKKKQMCLDRLIDICKDVMKIEVDAQKTFIENPKRYIIEQSKIKTGLMHIREDKFLELVGLPIDKIDKEYEYYNSFNVDIFAPIPSFEIHTTNEAQEIEYKAILKLCKELNSYKHALPLSIQIQFNMDILLKDSKWIPNYNKIMLI